MYFSLNRTIGSSIRRFRNVRLTYLSGKQFQDIADYSFLPGVKIPESVRIIYCKTDLAPQLFEQLRCRNTKVVVITHDGDKGISWVVEKCGGAVFDNVIHWYAQNADLEHPKVQGIPIGIANIEWPHGDFSRIKRIANSKLPKEINAYLCAKIGTNRQYRNAIYALCRQKPFITIKGGENRIGEVEYLQDVAKSRFTISPKGNGADSHRIWEALYLGSIPIVEKTVALRYFDKLPIVFVASFEQLSEEFLNAKYAEIKESIWAYDMLDISYWARVIRNKYGNYFKTSMEAKSESNSHTLRESSHYGGQ